jgi:hypothetical protein
MQNCKNCKYYFKSSLEGYVSGRCRRYPPQANPYYIVNELVASSNGIEIQFWDDLEWYAFPLVSEDNSCGEFVEASDHDILP